MWMKTNSAGFYGASKHSIMLALICEYIITAAIYRLIPLKLIKTDKGFSDQNLWQPLVKRMLTVNTESVAATWASGRGISGFGLSSEWSSALREVLVTADVFYSPLSAWASTPSTAVRRYTTLSYPEVSRSGAMWRTRTVSEPCTHKLRAEGGTLMTLLSGLSCNPMDAEDRM